MQGNTSPSSVGTGTTSNRRCATHCSGFLRAATRILLNSSAAVTPGMPTSSPTRPNAGFTTHSWSPIPLTCEGHLDSGSSRRHVGNTDLSASQTNGNRLDCRISALPGLLSGVLLAPNHGPQTDESPHLGSHSAGESRTTRAGVPESKEVFRQARSSLHLRFCGLIRQTRIPQRCNSRPICTITCRSSLWTEACASAIRLPGATDAHIALAYSRVGSSCATELICSAANSAFQPEASTYPPGTSAFTSEISQPCVV